MLPGNVASSISFGGHFFSPDDLVSSPLVDYERGGVALLDTTQGLMSHDWTCFMVGTDVFLQREGMEPILIFSQSQISELSFCFDQNMHYCVAYVQQDVMKLRWFDSSVGTYVITVFDNSKNPRLALDDKRRESALTSDMIFAYLRGNTLYYRQQRDRFTIERSLREGLPSGVRLKNIGMNKNMRLQFELV